ncbi:hypothetical protein AB0E88_16415 [Streptomyces sp. NPDC028635]|uniref:hypothetical protein n=1 Tax=Streptomyces sp. NPDC028635 TaxID=3154800 RepID=UPI0033C593E6
MSLTTVRRAGLAASVAALALLVSACGSGSDDKADDGKTAQADKTASAAPAAAKPLTAAELEKVVVAQADVKSGKVSEVAAKDEIAQGEIKTDKPACAPLADVQAGTYVGAPAAHVKRHWLADQKKPAAGAAPEEKLTAALDRTNAFVTLASYADGGAEKAFADLKSAVAACAGGYSWTAGSDKTPYAKVISTPAPQGGDEALALTSMMEADGDQVPVKAVVVRKGATVAYFNAVNFGAAATGKDYPFPPELLQAQLAKLG